MKTSHVTSALNHASIGREADANCLYPDVDRGVDRGHYRRAIHLLEHPNVSHVTVDAEYPLFIGHR